MLLKARRPHFADPEPNDVRAGSNIEAGLACSRGDLSQAFRLLYDARQRYGREPNRGNTAAIDQTVGSNHGITAVIAPTRRGLHVTPHHLLPTSEVFLAKHQGEAIATATLYGDGYLGLPSESTFPMEVARLRSAGSGIGELGSLASNRNAPLGWREAFAEMSRWIAQVAHARRIKTLITAVSPAQQKAFRRLLGFRVISQPQTACHLQGRLVVGMTLDLDQLVSRPIYRHCHQSPLPERLLQPYRWDSETRNHFRRIVEQSAVVESSGGIRGLYHYAAITGRLNLQ